MYRAEGFCVRCRPRNAPLHTRTLAVYSHSLHFWMSIIPTYKDIPGAMLFRTLGEQKKTLSKGTFSHILALATVKASRQCRDATQTGCRISGTLRVWHGVYGHVLVSDRVFGFTMSEQISFTRAGGILNDSGIDISSALRSSNTNFRIL